MIIDNNTKEIITKRMGQAQECLEDAKFKYLFHCVI